MDFRPKRNQHQALDAVYMSICTKKGKLGTRCGLKRVSFDNIDHHDWMMKFLCHRIADKTSTKAD